VIWRPATERICRISVLPLGRLTSSLAPVGTSTSRSTVTTRPATAAIRPPLALPASIGSDSAITVPGFGMYPSTPTLIVAPRVCSCSVSNAHLPARCAWPLLVQPTASTDTSRTPYSAMASSSNTGSLSVSKPWSGSSNDTMARLCRSRHLLPVYLIAPSPRICDTV